MLRKGNTALTKQVVHVDHAEQSAFFVSDGQYRDRFAFHELKKRGDRIALGPAAGRRRHDGTDRGLGIERPAADGPPDVAVGQDAADPVFAIEQKHGSKLALIQLTQGFRQEACFGKLRKALGPHDFADVELQALPQTASGMVAQEIFFRK